MSEEFTLPSGETAQLRGLTGFEMMVCAKKHDSDDAIAMNAFWIGAVLGVGEDGGLEWLKTHTAGDMVAMIKRIQHLSGLSEDAAKSSVADTGD